MEKLNLFKDFFIPEAFVKNANFNIIEGFENCLNMAIIRTIIAKLNKTKDYLGVLTKIAQDISDEKFVQNYLSISGIEFVGILFKVSKCFRKTILNLLFSKLFSIEFSDKLIINKTSQSDIYMYEVKLLIYLRNTFVEDVDVNYIINRLKEYNLGINNKKIEFSIFDILEDLVFEIRDTDLIFNIIDTHHYVSSLWSNGSLVFRNYTSHNETHSVEIIRTINRLLRTIEGLTLNYFEKYIVYMAAYLHDISLAIPPEKGQFIIDKKDENIIKLHKKMITQRNPAHEELTHSIHDITLEYLDLLSEKIRDKHAMMSAKIIEESKELMFLDFAHKSFIAEVSELHTDDYSKPRTCKHIKSNIEDAFSHHILDREKMSEMLRIGDVLDITNQRVKKIYLDNNSNYMTDFSRFQWASHLMTEDIQFTSTTKFNKKNKQRPLKQTITINVTLNYTDLELVKYDGYLDIKLKKNNNGALIGFKKNVDKKLSKIPFSILWFIEKNKYLFSEIEIFRKLLNEKYNFSEAIFKINISFSNKPIYFDSDLIKVIRKHVL